MTPDSITIRFPNGAWEFGFMDKTPEVGDTILRQGVRWVVTDVTALVDDHRSVTMALAPDLMDHDRPDVGTGWAGPIPSDAVIFRFAGKRSEYRLTDTKPEVGDEITHNGDNWVVVSVEAEEDGPTVVTLRAEPKPE